MAEISTGTELCGVAKTALADTSYFLPYLRSEKIEAIYLGKHASELTKFLREVAFGYLGVPIYQDVTYSTISENTKLAQKIHDEFQNQHLILTNSDSTVEKIFLFKNVKFVLDVVTLTFIMESDRWLELVKYCYEHGNRFIVLGTIVKDRYIHHTNIPRLDLLILVPQFLSDTTEPPELEIGTQMLKKKKKNEPKK